MPLSALLSLFYELSKDRRVILQLFLSCPIRLFGKVLWISSVTSIRETPCRNTIFIHESREGTFSCGMCYLMRELFLYPPVIVTGLNPNSPCFVEISPLNFKETCWMSIFCRNFFLSGWKNYPHFPANVLRFFLCEFIKDVWHNLTSPS